MPATSDASLSAGDKNRIRGRVYQRALIVLRERHKAEYEADMLLRKLKQESHDPYSVMRVLREVYRKDFDNIREQLYWAEVRILVEPEPTDEEREAALTSIREAMEELAAKDATECAEPEPDEAPRQEEAEPEQPVEIHAADPRPMTVHAALLLYLEERGCDMPPVEAITGLAELKGDPDARSFVREQVMVVAVIAHHLGTSVEECLDLGVAC